MTPLMPYTAKSEEKKEVSVQITQIEEDVMVNISKLRGIRGTFAFAMLATLLAVAFLLFVTGDVAQAQTPVVPANPTGLSATTVTHNSITLGWSDPGDSSISGYVILRRDPQTQVAGTFSTLDSDTGSASTTYTDSTVNAETRYVYRVKAKNSAGTSGRSNFVNIATSTAPVVQPTPTPTPVPTVPARPTGLTSTTVAISSVTISWDDPGDSSITGYQVLRRSRDGEVYEDGQGAAQFVAVVDDTGSAATTYTDTSVTPHTRYVYRVKARNSNGLSPWSSYLNVETPDFQIQTQNSPAKPTGLVVSVALDNSVVFDWSDPGDSSITHYKVLRREGDSGQFTTIEDNTGSADTSYTDTTVSADTAYEYRVIAVNGGGDSEESDSLSAQTSPESTVVVILPPEEEPEEPPTSEPQLGTIIDDELDTTPPTFVSAVTSRDGIEVKVTFSEDIVVGSHITTLATRYSIGAGWILKNVMTVTVDGHDNILFRSSYSGSVLTLRLEGPHVRTGQVVQVAYNNIFAQEPGGALVDSSGNAVELFDAQPVTNASVAGDTFTPAETPVLNKQTLSICEGQAGIYGVSLASQPTGNVGVSTLMNPARSILPSTQYLTFNTGNWDTPKTISVSTVVDDDDYTNWEMVYHRINGVALRLTYDKVVRIVVLEEDHASCTVDTSATGLPTISGEVYVGQTLTVGTSRIADVDGLTGVAYSYQWMAGGTDISGATGSDYTIVASNLSRTIQARVSFTDDAGNDETLTSAATVYVVGPLTISGATTTGYEENGAEAVVTYSAAGAGISTVAWSLSGDDSDDFSISSGGVLLFTSAPDYELPTDSDEDNVYSVTIEASASSGRTTTDMELQVTVTDADEAPVMNGG